MNFCSYVKNNASSHFTPYLPFKIHTAKLYQCTIWCWHIWWNHDEKLQASVFFCLHFVWMNDPKARSIQVLCVRLTHLICSCCSFWKHTPVKREGTVKHECDLLKFCTHLFTLILLFAQIYKGYGAKEEQGIYICTPKLFSVNWGNIILFCAENWYIYTSVTNWWYLTSTHCLLLSNNKLT